MVNFLKVVGTVLSVGSGIAGIIILRKGEESLDFYMGALLIILGIISVAVFFYFSNMLMNSEYQTELLEDIRNHFYPDEDESEES